jgi:glycine betaine/proline transport system ATP-binding protein
MSVAIEFRNVDIIFGKNCHHALAMLDIGKSCVEIFRETGAVLGCSGINLKVNRGEISVLMGLSGSGKSTLLRAVNGLNKVSRGNVLVNDDDQMVDVVTCSEASLRRVRREQVAMVFQQFTLLPWCTVVENVGFGLGISGISKAEYKLRVDRQLQLVGLDHQWANKLPCELSWGMQQRVGLARALATEAPILLMDEPFSALDPLIRTRLQDEFLQLQKTLKKTILFVSHDLEEALKLGNQISIMEEGRIVQTGGPKDIVLHPINDYVSEFIANVNSLNVLDAQHIMRRVDELKAEEDWIWLDESMTTRLKLGKKKEIMAIERNNQTAKWIPCVNAKDRIAEKNHVVFFAKTRTSLKTIILAIQNDEAVPIILINEDNTFAGVIFAADLLPVMSKSFQCNASY